ncbi:TIGR03862 family flavoprotein [Hydrogenophaga sp. PAMC20947]|nr:TIGR03862 family flavoprotein [Hydrogenophaga sp. PAMC20947]
MNATNPLDTLTALTDLDIDVAIIGGGPAGLMAAEVLSAQGHAVHLFDAMPSVGRKFLLAGKGGLNLTHAESLEPFLQRYAERADTLKPLLEAFGPQQVRDWAAGLGIDTFIGSSQRVFPKDMKAAPLLRAWLHRLRHPGPGGRAVQFHMRHRWQGPQSADPHRLVFETPQGLQTVRVRATVLALGGASWARLGSDGAWWAPLQDAGLDLAPLRPSNCGFEVAASSRGGQTEPAAGGWTPHFVERYAGQPLKTVSIKVTGPEGENFERQGEFVVTATGVEGSLVYAASSLLRNGIAKSGAATMWLNLLPDRTPEFVLKQVTHPRGSRSLSSHLKSRLGLDGVKWGLITELCDKATLQNPVALAAAIQALPLQLVATRPINEAISTAGGVRFEGLDAQLMATQRPSWFAAGEMLDWEAPTGGYLLTACLSSGRLAGQGAHAWLKSH